MMFSIPTANPFGGQATVSVDSQDTPLSGSLQALIKAQSAFANLNANNSVQTVSSAEQVVAGALTATGSQS